MTSKARLCRIVIFLHCLIFTNGLSLSRQSILRQVTNLATSIVASKVCFDGIGCFSTGGNFLNPLIRPLQLLPQSPKVIGTTYALYTGSNINEAQYIAYGDVKSVSISNFNAKLPTKIIIHGFLSNGNSHWCIAMKNAFLHQGDYNVVQLDWSRGSRSLYTQATANTRVVGALVAQLIKWLEKEFKADREDFHLLGHSLGAHIAGYAGERLREGSRQLGRITGMDPAGPFFENTHPEVRLDPTDARFVDAIHTDGDNLMNNLALNGGFGMMQPVGHVDFFPNGGKNQPGCSSNKQLNIKDIIAGIKDLIACSHERSHSLMISTIANANGNYNAFPCDSYASFKAGKCSDCGSVGCAQMGLRANEWDAQGRTNVKMFLETSEKAPFESIDAIFEHY